MSSVYSQPRVDGRQPSHLRPVSLSFGEFSRADGSCSFASGDSSASCSVTGPVEAKQLYSSFQGLAFDVSVRPVSGVPTSIERLLESQVAALLRSVVETEKYPYMQLNVSIEVKSSDGSLAAVVLNAAVLAVLHTSAVSMRTVPLSVSLAHTHKGLLIDPDAAEELNAGCETLSVCMHSGRVLQSGGSNLEIVTVFDAISLAQAAVAAIAPSVRKALGDHLAPLLNRVIID